MHAPPRRWQRAVSLLSGRASAAAAAIAAAEPPPHGSPPHVPVSAFAAAMGVAQWPLRDERPVPGAPATRRAPTQPITAPQSPPLSGAPSAPSPARSSRGQRLFGIRATAPPLLDVHGLSSVPERTPSHGLTRTASMAPMHHVGIG